MLQASLFHLACAVSERAWYEKTQSYTHTNMQYTHFILYAVFQCDQQSSRTEASGGDPNVITEAHRQHRGHLLCLLHYLWNPGSTGEGENSDRNNEGAKMSIPMG